MLWLWYRNGKIYITDSNETILVYNKTGTMLIQFFKDQSGDNLYSNIISLTVSQKGEIIYVADNRFADSTYGLELISKEGQLHGKYNCNNLRGLRKFVKQTVVIFLFVVHYLTILYNFIQTVKW
jgi:hypothetical protein